MGGEQYHTRGKQHNCDKQTYTRKRVFITRGCKTKTDQFRAGSNRHFDINTQNNLMPHVALSIREGQELCGSGGSTN